MLKTTQRALLGEPSRTDLVALQRSAGNRAVGQLLAQRRSRPTPTGPAGSPGARMTVQRHSSWEHSLLGDAKPAVLAQIGTWQDLIAQTTAKGAKKLVGSVVLPGVGAINKGDVMHTLVQEMSRLSQWQTNPPTAASTDDAYNQAGKDPTFDVVVVRLPDTRGGKSMLITYGELNTLADFYGSVDVMKSADPAQRRQIVQSVRKETFLRLKEIYEKLSDSLTTFEKKDKSARDAKEQFSAEKLGKTKFAGAATPDFISGKKGQADLLAGDKPLIGQGTGAGGGVNAYGATLARNACHFVPESWHAWADAHDKGRAAALDSWAALAKARKLKQDMAAEDYSRRPLDRVQAEADLRLTEAQVSRLANEALLNNGFGDHYLQDSYAAGHMINKTQIMQWYVEFVDKNDEWDYFKDENWRRVQQMAYGQKGLSDPGQYNKAKVKGADPNDRNPNLPRNPQSVENIGGDDWMVRFTALGLQVPSSLSTPGSHERQLVEWWQLIAGLDSGKRERTGAQLAQGRPGFSRAELEAALLRLLADGVVRTEEENTVRGAYMKDGLAGARFTDFRNTAFMLRSDYIPRNMQKFRAATQASKRGDDSSYQRMAAAVSYSDYIQFMESGFIQKATNALHDVFCAKGLSVMTAAGGEAFKVYGDDAMFNAESSKGVQESGITANMSRDSILSIINTGTDGGKTTSSILDRLPSRVRFDTGGGHVVDEPIETWHNSNKRGYLKDQCMTEVFPGMSWSVMQKLVPGVAGSSLGEISRDKVHGQEAF